jgi:hypothetical protein
MNDNRSGKLRTSDPRLPSELPYRARKEQTVSLHTSILTAILAASLLAPAAASAAAAQPSHSHTTEATVRGKGSDPALKTTTLGILSTPSDMYVHVPATKETPSTYIYVGACQMTDDCTGAVIDGD